MALTAISADGTKLTAHNAGHGPPVLLVHGSTADHTRWAPMLPALTSDFTVVALDRRGRGGSCEESAVYSIDREVEDILAIVAELVEPPILFSHSYGASVTLRGIERLGSVVSSFVLYEPAFPTPGHDFYDDAQLARWQAALDRGERDALLEWFYREAVGLDTDDIAAQREMPSWSARVAAVHTIVREARAVKHLTFAPTHVDVPVRLLVGEQTTPPLAAATRAAASMIGHSELHVLQGQGHVAIDTAPELVAWHVRQASPARHRDKGFE